MFKDVNLSLMMNTLKQTISPKINLKKLHQKSRLMSTIPMFNPFLNSNMLRCSDLLYQLILFLHFYRMVSKSNLY